MLPLHIEDYRLLAEIGRGGQGVVCIAEHIDGLLVAIKIARPDLTDDERAHFDREAELHYRIASRYDFVPAVLARGVVDPGDGSTTPYIVMEYVQGTRLQDRVAHLALVDVARTLRALLQYLHVLHGNGIVHRDIKPGNVLLREDGPCLLDFGIARSLTRPASNDQAIGTRGYTAPEQWLTPEQTDPRSDLFSVGALAYEALTRGHLPYGHSVDGTAMARLHAREVASRILAGDCRLRPIRDHVPTAPPRTSRVVERALSARADQRYASALEMQRELVAALRDDQGQREMATWMLHRYLERGLLSGLDHMLARAAIEAPQNDWQQRLNDAVLDTLGTLPLPDEEGDRLASLRAALDEHCARGGTP